MEGCANLGRMAGLLLLPQPRQQKVGTPTSTRLPPVRGFLFQTSSDERRHERAEQRHPVPLHRGGMAQQIETSWQDRWDAEAHVRTPRTRPGRMAEPEEGSRLHGAELSVLDMFPYPSGRAARRSPAGLHRQPTSTAASTRMIGTNVLHALGYDAFGLPAEQYAVQTGQHPRNTTEANMTNGSVARSRARSGLRARPARSVRHHRPGASTAGPSGSSLQMFEGVVRRRRGARPAWASAPHRCIEEFESGAAAVSTPDGRGWTEPDPRRAAQGARRATALAYTYEAPVNWCPGLGTVLSNEEVTPSRVRAPSATSRCSGAACGSGRCASPRTRPACWTTWIGVDWPGR